MKSIVILFLSIFLVGCAITSEEYIRSQGASGQTLVDVKMCHDSKDEKYLCGVSWKDGKEKQSIKLKIELPNGAKLDYTADNVVAFDGQAIRAAVEQELAGATAETIDAVTRSIIRALIIPSAIEGAAELGGAAIMAP